MVDLSIVFCMFTRPGNSVWRFGDAEAHLVPPISPRHSPCSDPGEKESWRHGTRASLGQEFLSWKLGSWDWWFQTWRFYFPYIGWCARLTQVFELHKLIWLVVPNMTGLWLSISSKRDEIPKPIDELFIFFKMGTASTTNQEVTAAMQLLRWHMSSGSGVLNGTRFALGAVQRQSAELFFAALAGYQDGPASQWMLDCAWWSLCFCCFFVVYCWCFFRSQKMCLFPSHWIYIRFTRPARVRISDLFISWVKRFRDFARIKLLEESISLWPYRLEGWFQLARALTARATQGTQGTHHWSRAAHAWRRSLVLCGRNRWVAAVALDAGRWADVFDVQCQPWINKPLGCWIGRVPVMYHIVTIWRVPP